MIYLQPGSSMNSATVNKAKKRGGGKYQNLYFSGTKRAFWVKRKAVFMILLSVGFW